MPDGWAVGAERTETRTASYKCGKRQTSTELPFIVVNCTPTIVGCQRGRQRARQKRSYGRGNIDLSTYETPKPTQVVLQPETPVLTKTWVSNGLFSNGYNPADGDWPKKYTSFNELLANAPLPMTVTEPGTINVSIELPAKAKVPIL